MIVRLSLSILSLVLSIVCIVAYAQGGSRPSYVYDNADMISQSQQSLIERYLRMVDSNTTAEIVIYTISDFTGHGVVKDGVEINDRDMLANYIFNEVSLDGIKGIGKKGKDNGILILMSLVRDSGGGSIRLEVGRGLEGDITDGTAGEILDSYLVPARQEFEETGNKSAFDSAFLDTVIAIGNKIGFTSSDPMFSLRPAEGSEEDPQDAILGVILFVAIIGAIIVLSAFGSRGRRRGAFRRHGYGWGSGGSGGGGFGGGGGSSGGGGAGR